MAACLSSALWSTLTHPLWQDIGSFPLAFLALVSICLVTLYLAALPRHAGESVVPPGYRATFVWIAWPMVPVSAMPITLALLDPSDLSALWPFGLFPLGALAFALLCTHAYRQERREHRPKGEAPR